MARQCFSYRLGCVVLGFGFAMLWPGLPGVAEELDPDSLDARPSFTERIQQQMEAGQPATPPPPEAAPGEASPGDDMSPGIGSEEPVAAPPVEAAPDPVDDSAAIAPPVSAPPVTQPASPKATPLDAEARNRQTLIIFVVVVLVLVVLSVLARVLFEANRRQRLRRKHRLALVHAHDQHPVGKPDPDAEALDRLLKGPPQR